MSLNTGIRLGGARVAVNLVTRSIHVDDRCADVLLVTVDESTMNEQAGVCKWNAHVSSPFCLSHSLQR